MSTRLKEILARAAEIRSDLTYTYSVPRELLEELGRLEVEFAQHRAPASSARTQEDRTRIADANLNALLTYTGGFYSVAMEHGMKRGATANAIAHVESAARALHRLAVTPNSATSTTNAEQLLRDARAWWRTWATSFDADPSWKSLETKINAYLDRAEGAAK